LVASRILVGMLLVTGCSPRAVDHAKESGGPVYADSPVNVENLTRRFAIHPLHNPAKLCEAYGPLIDYLNARMPGARLELEASRDYADFERKYRAHRPEVILSNPWQTLQAMKAGYHVIAMAGEAEDFKGLFIARRDAGLTEIGQLRNRVVAYPSRTALAACIMPQWYMHEHGLDVNRDIINRYVGSQESAIMNAYLGEAAVGCTWPPPWRAFQAAHPKEAGELVVLWETSSLRNNSVMIRDDQPPGFGARLQELLLGLQDNPEGRKVLAGMETARFGPATSADYQVVQEYINRFEAVVRPVDQ
jgi:phosphonate transport system substrate-binding protein